MKKLAVLLILILLLVQVYPVHGDDTGDNHGTVKISETGAYEPPAGASNDPHVPCVYYIQGYRLEAITGTLTVTSWEPNLDAGTVVITDSYTGTPEEGGPGGYFFSNGPYTSTVGGHFKVDVTDEPHPKSKVYWVDGCETPTPTDTVTPTATATDTPTETVTPTETSVVPIISPTSTQVPTEVPSAIPTASPTSDSTRTAVPTATPTIPATPTSVATSTPTATSTDTVLLSPTPTGTAVPDTATPTQVPSATATPTKVVRPHHVRHESPVVPTPVGPSRTPVPTPTATRTSSPTATVVPVHPRHLLTRVTVPSTPTPTPTEDLPEHMPATGGGWVAEAPPTATPIPHPSWGYGRG